MNSDICWPEQAGRETAGSVCEVLVGVSNVCLQPARGYKFHLPI